MNDHVPHKLQHTEDLAETAAFIADSILEKLPSEIALITKQCLILHWFDADILKVFLQNTGYPSRAYLKVYDQIADLPFVESRSEGVAFNKVTRKGLLSQYVRSQSALFINAASMMAPIYEVREEYGSMAAEAFFCYIVSNNTHAATKMLDKLLDEALSREDWQYITSLLRLRDEALQLPFVQAFPLTERQWILKGLAHRVQGEQDAAIAAYREAVECNPRNILSHMMLGAIYIDQERYQEAVQEYDTVVELDATHVQALINKGIVYLRWPQDNQYDTALSCFKQALQIDPNNADAKAYRQQLLQRISHRATSIHEIANYLVCQTQEKLEISSSDYTRSRYWSASRIRTFVGIVCGVLPGLVLVFIFNSLVGNLGDTFFVLIWDQVSTFIKANLWLSFITLIILIGVISDLVKFFRRGLEKVADKQESKLWLESQRYMHGEIGPDKLETIKRSHTRNVRKSVIGLAQRNTKGSLPALARK